MALSSPLRNIGGRGGGNGGYDDTSSPPPTEEIVTYEPQEDFTPYYIGAGLVGVTAIIILTSK